MEPFCYYRVLKLKVSINEFENISCFYLKTHSSVFFFSSSLLIPAVVSRYRRSLESQKLSEICFKMKLLELKFVPREAFNRHQLIAEQHRHTRDSKSGEMADKDADFSCSAHTSGL